jgi:hypothetical protein
MGRTWNVWAYFKNRRVVSTFHSKFGTKEEEGLPPKHLTSICEIMFFIIHQIQMSDDEIQLYMTPVSPIQFQNCTTIVSQSFVAEHSTIQSQLYLPPPTATWGGFRMACSLHHWTPVVLRSSPRYDHNVHVYELNVTFTFGIKCPLKASSTNILIFSDAPLVVHSTPLPISPL